MAVIATIHTIADQEHPAARRVVPMPLAPKSRNTYWPAIWARLAITRMSATMMPQPPNHPVLGPKARVAQVNVVPQSGSALFSAL